MATLPSKNALNDLTGGYYSYWTDGTTEGRATVAVLLGSTDAQAAAASLGSLALGTDLAVTHGGTGASTAADARTNLGLVIGTDVQAYSSRLASIASLTPASSLIIGNGLGGYEMVTPANFITNNNILDTGDIGSSVQAYSATLAAVAAGTYTGSTSITTLGTITTGTVPAARVSAGTFQSGAFVFAGAVSGITSLTTSGNVYAKSSTITSTWPLDGANEGGVAVGSGHQDGRLYAEGSVSASVVLYDSGGTANLRTFGVQINADVAKIYSYNDSGTIRQSWVTMDPSTALMTLAATTTNVSGDLRVAATKKSYLNTSSAYVYASSDTSDAEVRHISGGYVRVYVDTDNDQAGSAAFEIYRGSADGATSGWKASFGDTIQLAAATSVSGGAMTLAAGTTSYASLNVPVGTAPTSPSNGDMWFIGDVMYRRIGGVTKSVTFT